MGGKCDLFGLISLYQLFAQGLWGCVYGEISVG